MSLPDDGRLILELEREYANRPQRAKEREVRARLGLSVTTYYQRLNELLDNPSALRASPVLVSRLRRLREKRRRVRFARPKPQPIVRCRRLLKLRCAAPNLADPDELRFETLQCLLKAGHSGLHEWEGA